MKARGRLAIALGVVMAILLFAAGLAYLNTRALDDTARAVRMRHRVEERLSALERALLEADAAARRHAAEATAETASQAGAARAGLDARLAETFTALADQPELQRRAETLADLVRRQSEALGALEGSRAGAAADPPRLDAAAWTGALAAARAAIDDVRAACASGLAALDARWDERVARADALLAIGVLIGLGIFTPVFLRLYQESRKAEQAHDALRESEEHFRLLVESVRDYAIFAVDPSGAVMSWNRGAERIAGYSSEEIVGRHLSRFYPPEEVSVARPALDLERAAREGVCESEGHRVRKDGSLFWASTVISPLHDDSGRIRGFSVSLRDVSERKRVEDALVESEARHGAVSELTSDYAYAFRVEPDGSVAVEWVAGAFARITGYTGDEVEKLGGGIALVHPDDLNVALARVRNLIARRPDTSEFRILTKSGEVRWIRESARPMWDEGSDRLRVYGAAQDITDRRRAEDEARRHQAELAHVLRVATINEMAAGLAHEINQPLAAIVSYARGCARRIRSGSGEGSELLHAVDEIAAQAIRADEIVRRLQGFVRKEAPQRDAVEVNDLVRGAVRLVAGEAAERQVAVQLELAAALPGTLADRIQIEQVILNLVRNAFDAMSSVPHDRRTLSITTSPAESGEVVVAVRDAGEGIRRECLGEIFTPFFTTKSSGLGMGLAISRSIVEAHGGRIWASSEPGRGTTFAFTLPVERG